MAFSDAPLVRDEQGRILITRPINWNRMEDPMDLEIWNKLVSQFWVPEKIALSNDLRTWNTLTPEEKEATSKVFTGLAGLDSVQGHIGAPQLALDAVTQHEVAVLNNIAFMEEVHAKSYSATSATFLSSEEVEHYWRWFAENEQNQAKLNTVVNFYYGKDPLMKKAASTILESFLFYSGFYLPLHWSTQAKLTNTGDLIRLIIRDEAVHGFYIGYKFQQQFKKLSEQDQEEVRDSITELLLELYENEEKYTEDIYDSIGLTEDVKGFLRYNANKALQNLGFDEFFKPSDCQFSPAIRASLTLTSETHDFFSGAGSSYTIAPVEELTEEDYEDLYGENAMDAEALTRKMFERVETRKIAAQVIERGESALAAAIANMTSTTAENKDADLKREALTQMLTASSPAAEADFAAALESETLGVTESVVNTVAPVEPEEGELRQESGLAEDIYGSHGDQQNWTF